MIAENAILTLLMTVGISGCTPAGPRRLVSLEEIAGRTAPPADHRIAYGSSPFEFGDLRLPHGDTPYPVAVIIHGGCWRSEIDLRHISLLSASLTGAGIATWTLEYRRVGETGGGWPATFEDVAAGTDYVRMLAQRFPLDVNRVVLVGHSAGGHLALWLAGRRNLPPGSPLVSSVPLAVRGVVSLAGVPDLRTFGAGSTPCNALVASLLGGTPEAVPGRYREASPIDLLPLGVPERLLHGALDPIVPVNQSRDFVALARSKGDDAQLLLVDGAGHFELIAPFSRAWPKVEQAVLSLLSRR